MRKSSLSAAFFAARLLCMGSSFAQELPSCSSRNVTYGAFDDHFSEKMSIQPGPVTGSIAGKEIHAAGNAVDSCQNARFMRPGPWTTAVWVGDSMRGVPQMLTFADHGSGGVNICWLNEKLLYGSVWWGRIVSTDFVYDVEDKRFIYREMADYGDLVQPCK